MKRLMMVFIGIAMMMPLAGTLSPGLAGSLEDVKKESREAVSEIREGVAETGKAVAETGKEVKDGAKQVGMDIKKAFQETREAIKKKFTEDDHNTENAENEPKDE